MKKCLKKRNPWGAKRKEYTKRKIHFPTIRRLQRELKAIIKKRKLSQVQVAKLAHVPSQVISRDLANPRATLRSLAAIGHALGYRLEIKFVKK